MTSNQFNLASLRVFLSGPQRSNRSEVEGSLNICITSNCQEPTDIDGKLHSMMRPLYDSGNDVSIRRPTVVCDLKKIADRWIFLLEF